LFRQQPDGTFAAEPLEPAPPDVHHRCRPAPGPGRGPRVLTRLRPDAEAMQVVVLDPHGRSTLVQVCDRAGRLLYEQRIERRWPLGPRNRLVDLNGDRRPDIVQAGGGGYRVMENISGQGCGPGE